MRAEDPRRKFGAEKITIRSGTCVQKFKISTLTITLSNLEDLSDVFGESDLINKSVAVFYKTPSCEELINCFPIYIANVRRYDHTNKNIKK